MQVPALADRVVIAAGRAHAATGGDRRLAYRDAFLAGAVVTRVDTIDVRTLADEAFMSETTAARCVALTLVRARRCRDGEARR